MAEGPVFVVGDVHGHLDEVIVLLRRAGLMSESLTWTGGAATVWFIGDFPDRGPNGLAAIDLAMWLQREAAKVGGRVDALLGNHDFLLVAARRFGGAFLANWRRNGGVTSDLKGLQVRQAQWLLSRPAMARAGDRLLVHADATFYELYGRTVEEVNAAIAAVLGEGDPAAWDRLLEHFSERRAFDDSAPGGSERAAAFLARFGARVVVHGHTPIGYATGERDEAVEGPYVYAEGRCVNVDGGLYLGGPGLLYRIDAAGDERSTELAVPVDRVADRASTD
jgi:Calcineurin-like phosphoesterase